MLWLCRACSTRFAPGLPACPHCGSRDHEEWNGIMPRITKHEGIEPPKVDEPEPELDEPAEVVEDEPKPKSKPHTKVNAGHAAGRASAGRPGK
jgi:hypothetical protein